MSEFEDYAYAAISSALEAVPAAEAEDVYVVSLLDHDEEQDPRYPTLLVGFNTETRVRAVALYGIRRRRGALELRMVDLELPVLAGRQRLGRNKADGFDRTGCVASDSGTPMGTRKAIDAAIEALGTELSAMAVRIVQRLHASGLIERTFGRPIPVLIHEYEYYDKIAEQNERANPPDLVADFSRWVLGDRPLFD